LLTLRWRGMDSKIQFRDASPLVNSVGTTASPTTGPLITTRWSRSSCAHLCGTDGLHDSPLEGTGFEISVPRHSERNSFARRGTLIAAGAEPFRNLDVRLRNAGHDCSSRFGVACTGINRGGQDSGESANLRFVKRATARRLRETVNNFVALNEGIEIWTKGTTRHLF
jgi:hypothetical protein